MEEIKKAVRIQTSFLNAAEKKALVWLAERMPRRVTSDHLTLVGIIGSIIIAAGYILSRFHISFLWLATFGFVVNWFGDSLDGTLARVRNTQRPIYGYYLDHTVDVINEIVMFVGIGLSPLVNLDLAVSALGLYLILTLNVSMNAHLRKEFRLTYAKLGPTEFRLLMIFFNCLFLFVRPIREYSHDWVVIGRPYTTGIFDYFAIFVIVVLLAMYIFSVVHDLRYYAKIDPPKKF
jgi:phosphatidylglycerophosphate synthase